MDATLKNETGTEIDDKDCEKKRNTRSNTNDNSAVRVIVRVRGEDNTKHMTKKAKITSSKSNVSSSLSSSLSSSKKIIDTRIDDEEYWAKLQKMSKNSSLSIKARDQRSKNLRDAIDGVDTLRCTVDLDDDHGDGDHDYDHDGTENIHMDEEEREQRMASMGLVTGKSSLVGTRRLFGINYASSPPDLDDDDYNNNDTSRRGMFSLFQNIEEVMSEIQSIIQKMDKPASRRLSQSNRKMWNAIRNQVINPITKAIKADLLPLILEKRKEWGGGATTKRGTSSKTDDGDNSMIIPFNLIRWLIRTSSSGKNVGTELHIGAKEMICRLLRSSNIIILDTDLINGDSDVIDSGVINHVFHIQDFANILQLEFGLWVKEGPPPLKAEEQNDQKRTTKSFGNESGLRHVFEIWSVAFEKDLIAWDRDVSISFLLQSSDHDGVCIFALTAKIIAILCRSGLDHCFHSGHRLLEAQSHLFNQIFDWVLRRFETESSDISSFDKWIEHSAEMSVQLCSGLSTDIIAKGETKSDQEGWLPLVLAVRTCQTVDQTNEKIVMFFALFSCRAAQLCLGSITNNWDIKIKKNVEALMIDIHGDDYSPSTVSKNDLRIKCVVTSEIILESIRKAEDVITRDGPWFLAAVDIALHCEQMGITLFNMNVQNIVKPVGIYENRAEAGAMSGHFKRLENLCTVLKNKVHSVMVDKNMMRVKELLSLVGGFYRENKDKASSLVNRRESLFTKQANMDMFIKSEKSSPDKDAGQ